MENPNAIITSNARIFLLEIFLIALLIIPTHYTFADNKKWATKKEPNKRGILIWAVFGLMN